MRHYHTKFSFRDATYYARAQYVPEGPSLTVIIEDEAGSVVYNETDAITVAGHIRAWIGSQGHDA